MPTSTVTTFPVEAVWVVGSMLITAWAFASEPTKTDAAAQTASRRSFDMILSKSLPICNARRLVAYGAGGHQPSLCAEIDNIHDAITVHVSARIEACLPHFLSEGRLDDCKVGAVDDAIAIEITLQGSAADHEVDGRARGNTRTCRRAFADDSADWDRATRLIRDRAERETHSGDGAGRCGLQLPDDIWYRHRRGAGRDDKADCCTIRHAGAGSRALADHISGWYRTAGLRGEGADRQAGRNKRSRGGELT